MRKEEQRIYSFRRICKGFACLLAVIVVLVPNTRSLAGGCFPDLYYSAMFNPIAQKAYEGGDTRLVAMSDYLAAKGEDPHDKGGSGCMCGVNNGRWDQVLLNRSELDLERAPVTFKIDAISAGLFDRKGNSMKTGFEIKPPALTGCLDGALKMKGWSSWRNGRLAKAGILEPGENMLGCVCLKPSDRSKSGYVKLKVAYTPLVLVQPVPGREATPRSNGRHLELTDYYDLKDMRSGSGRYFRILPPAEKEWKLTKVTVELAQAEQLELFTSPDWHNIQSRWRSGSLKDTGLEKDGLWILVRAKDKDAQGQLKVRLTYECQGDKEENKTYQPPPAKLEKISVGPSATRTFKSYVLGMASKNNNAFETATQRPCCDGSR